MHVIYHLVIFIEDLLIRCHACFPGILLNVIIISGARLETELFAIVSGLIGILKSFFDIV